MVVSVNGWLIIGLLNTPMWNTPMDTMLNILDTPIFGVSKLLGLSLKTPSFEMDDDEVPPHGDSRFCASKMPP